MLQSRFLISTKSIFNVSFLLCALALPVLAFQNCGGFSAQNLVASSHSAALLEQSPPVPLGIAGTFSPIFDATFGTQRSGATVKDRSDLDSLAYYWFIYGEAGSDPAYWTQSANPNDCHGPSGNGVDGLYGNFYSRFMHCAPGSPWDRHVLLSDRLVLKAACGLQDGDVAHCQNGNIGSGMLRFIPSFRPTAARPIVVEMQAIMPSGMYSWPAFWLNPGEQAPRNPDGSPGAVLSSGWPPEIDLFDNYGFNNTPPGHYLIMATPDGGNAAPYASPLCASQNLSICDLPLTPPMHLILSNQTAAEFNDLSGLVDQGGVAGGWDWQISYVRVWQQTN